MSVLRANLTGKQKKKMANVTFCTLRKLRMIYRLTDNNIILNIVAYFVATVVHVSADWITGLTVHMQFALSAAAVHRRGTTSTYLQTRREEQI